MRPLAILAILLALGTAPAAARDITAEEGAALEQTIADFAAATRAADATGVLAVMPPAILERIAFDNGLTVADLRAAMVRQIAAIAREMADDDFAMDTAAAEHRELEDGSPYLVIPTTTVMRSAGSPTTTSYTPTLAFMEEGAWYFVRIADETQIKLLTAAYPQFTGVAFPEARTEIEPP